MKVIVVANVEQQEEIESKNTRPDTDLIFVKDLADVRDMEYDAIFYLHENDDNDLRNFVDKPVFINSVINTLAEKNLPLNFSRLNGWPGFLKSKTWEIASNDEAMATKVFESLKWNVMFLKDEPGFVSTRVICMVINEAFFALEDGISTMDEIDLAMKLGTNYPYGPFEWQKKIGLSNIYHLLTRLSLNDKRYTVSRLLENKYLECGSSKIV